MAKAKPRTTAKPKAAAIPKNKKAKPAPDLISISELARRAGCTRSAASQWVSAQERAGVKLAQPAGRRGKLLDANNPLVMRYIDNTAGNVKRNESQSGSDTIRKIRFQVASQNLKNEMLRDKYVSTNSVIAVLKEFCKLENEIYSGFAKRVCDKIEKEFGIVIPSNERGKAQKLVDDIVRSAQETNWRMVCKFIKDNAKEKATA